MNKTIIGECEKFIYHKEYIEISSELLSSRIFSDDFQYNILLLNIYSDIPERDYVLLKDVVHNIKLTDQYLNNQFVIGYDVFHNHSVCYRIDNNKEIQLINLSYDEIKNCFPICFNFSLIFKEEKHEYNNNTFNL